MDPKVLQFVTKHRVGVLSLVLPDGQIHGATLHFSHQENPFRIFMSTTKNSRKCQGLLDGVSAKASFVIGFSEEEWLTMQLDGKVKAVLAKSELDTVKAIHYLKHPGSQQYEHDPETIFLEFIPHWWRFSDYNKTPPLTLSSED